MKNPINGTFTNSNNTFNVKSISNGQSEALESSVICIVVAPKPSFTSPSNC